jgi:hypothetical protein
MNNEKGLFMTTTNAGIEYTLPQVYLLEARNTFLDNNPEILMQKTKLENIV